MTMKTKKIVIKSTSGFCPVEYAYNDKLTITANSIAYEYKPSFPALTLSHPVFLFSLQAFCASLYLVREALNVESLEGMVRLVRAILLVTLICEVAGAVLIILLSFFGNYRGCLTNGQPLFVTYSLIVKEIRQLWSWL